MRGFNGDAEQRMQFGGHVPVHRLAGAGALSLPAILMRAP